MLISRHNTIIPLIMGMIEIFNLRLQNSNVEQTWLNYMFYEPKSVTMCYDKYIFYTNEAKAFSELYSQS